MRIDLDPDGLASRPVGSEPFRVALRDLAGAVALVTTRVGARRAGCVVSSLISYELEPPTLLLALSAENSTATMLAQSRRFGVSVASDSAGAVVDGFARAPAGEARFAHGAWREAAPTGQWVLDDALVSFECALEEVIVRHSHLIVLGRVETITKANAPKSGPLVHWRRAYRTLARQ